MLFLILGSGCSEDSSSGGSGSTEILWTRTFGTSEIEEGWSVAVGTSGNVFVSGFYDTASGTDGILLLKYSDQGVLLTNRIDTGVAQAGVKIVAAQDGSLYLAYHDNSGDLSTHIRKYSSDLSLQWDQTLDSGAYNEAVHDMVIDGDLLYVTGTINGNAFGATGSDYYDLLIGCFNISSKSWVWQTVTDGSNASSGWDYGAAIVMDDDYLYVTGDTNGDLDGNGSNTSTTPFIAKFSKAGHTNIWTVIHEDAGGNDIAIDSTGSIYVTGKVGVSKFDSSGKFIAKITVVGEAAETESGQAILCTSSGKLVITGIIGDGNTTYTQSVDAYIGVFNSGSDSVLWSSMYGEPSLDNGTPAMAARDEGQGLCSGVGGSVYIVGQTASVTFAGETNPGGSGNYDVFLMKMQVE